MTEPLISVAQLKKTSVEAIVTQDIDFLTKLHADVTSFLSRITKDMQASYLKYVRSKALTGLVGTSTKKWVFNFSVGDPRPEYCFLIIKTFKDQGYIIKESQFKKGYYLVSDVPFDEEPDNKQPVRLITASHIISPADEILFRDSPDPHKEAKNLSLALLPLIETSPRATQLEPPINMIIPAFKGLFEYINQMTHKLAQLDQLFILTQLTQLTPDPEK